MVRLPAPRPFHDWSALLGRVLLGAIFVVFGTLKAISPTATIAGFARLGLPAPTMVYLLTVLIELGGGSLFVTGTSFRPIALLLAIWSVASALVAHTNFADMNMLIHFWKNVSMSGGFIYAALLGAGAYSVDAFRVRRRDTSAFPD